MKTDFDKTIELLDLFDVEYELYNEVENSNRVTTIILSPYSKKVRGIHNLISEYTFINGKFQDIGIWDK